MALATTAIIAASTGTALGGSVIYMLLGGGFFGAVLIFMAIKMFGG